LGRGRLEMSTMPEPPDRIVRQRATVVELDQHRA
jgi:hypothetical protein